MEICFKKLTFTVVGDCIRLARFGAFSTSNAKPFAAVHVCGENKPRGGKLIHASECENLRYVSHTLTDDCLTIVQKSELVEVKTVLQGNSDTDAVSVYTEVKNLSAEELVLEEVSAFVVGCLGENTLVEIPIKEGVCACKVAYPIVTDAKLTVENGGVSVAFSSSKQAVFLELEVGY